MLKIKDNIELKELEKYGFKYVGRGYKKDIIFDNNNMNPNTFELQIWEDKRVLLIYVENQPEFLPKETRNVDVDGWSDGFEMDVLYDLIKADLVEKVND